MRRLVIMPVTLAALALVAAGCKHDGREMRPALPSQNGSVSTTAASTVPPTEDDFFNTAPSEPASTSSTSSSTTSSSTTSSSTTSTTAVTSTTAPPTTSTATAPAFTLTAPWRDGAPIDPRYTCKGANVSPALTWSQAPAGTLEIAVTMIDQDAPFAHWAMTGLAADRTGLAEAEVPQGAAVAVNGSGAPAYTGPCPPAGATHTYRITVAYLNKALGLTSGGTSTGVRAAIDAATIATAKVTGTFTS